MTIKRRDFLAGATGVIASTAGLAALSKTAPIPLAATDPRTDPRGGDVGADGQCATARDFNSIYQGRDLEQIAYPMGGLGAGMICLEGAGALSKFSLRHRPNLTSQPTVFAALSIQSPREIVRIIEGPVPDWKLHPHFFDWEDMPRAHAAMTWGLSRFREATFAARFPFADISLKDDEVPLQVKITGWSPFSPGDADNASLPVAALEYEFTNPGATAVEAVFSFNSENFMAQPDHRWLADKASPDRIRATPGGFILGDPGSKDRPWDAGYCAVWVDDADVQVNHAWFSEGLGLLFDSVQMVWNGIRSGRPHSRDPLRNAPALGASISVPLKIAPGQSKTIAVRLAWFVPNSNLSSPAVEVKDAPGASAPNANAGYRPWYAGRFADIEAVKDYWQSQYHELKRRAEKFSQALYDCTLPPEVMEAVSVNLTTLKSPTVLRQTDGRLWAWEGTGDEAGAGGPGSCTHVWAYAQALPHLFPDLERSLRETEFGPDLGTDGFQAHRAALPIRSIGDTDIGRKEPAAGDGQLGGIIKVYRDWRISGNTRWLRELWPKIRASLEYCIRSWDPKRRGSIEEPRLTTYDVNFWGADGLCASLYVGALKAATAMGEALGENVTEYSDLIRKSIHRTETDLFNGKYFCQKVQWKNLQTPFPNPQEPTDWMVITSTEGLALSKEEGPPYQYGPGCLSDGVLGSWLCRVAGVDDALDAQKIESHLNAVYRHNFKQDLSAYAQVGRSYLGMGAEAGLLVCTWPNGHRPSLPMIYADEVWTGIEYQVASHLIMFGHIDKGLDIVRAARRRYNGRIRNPFAEAEAGQWYARAMSSYALLQAFSGARFDAVDQVLHLKPAIKGDFRCFLSTATGYGTVGVKDHQPFLEVVSGTIPYKEIRYVAA